MKLYLTPELQAHRRGRFLASLLGISQTSELGLPKTGFVLMTGEALQASRETQEECTAWVRQPGCSLLLLPPYQKGAIIDFLDWEIELALSGSTADHQALLANILAGEMTYNLLGADGACTDDMSQQGGLAIHAIGRHILIAVCLQPQRYRYGPSVCWIRLRWFMTFWLVLKRIVGCLLLPRQK